MIHAETRFVRNSPAGVTTLFFYDPEGRLLEEYIPATSTGKDYIWLPGSYEPIARVDFSLNDADTGDVLRCTKSSPNVHLDWTLFGGSGRFVARRGAIGDYSSFSNLNAPAGTKTLDDPVLGDASSYWYDVRNRTLADTLYFYHADHLGTPIAMTDATGTLAWRAEHYPFGGIYALPVSTIPNNLRFPGQYYDGETGLAQNWNREYLDKLGRYYQPDPLSVEAIKSHFIYSNNNPVVFLDPQGTSTFYCCRKIKGGLVKVGRLWAHCFLVLNGHSYGFNEHGDNKVIPDDPADKDRSDCTAQDCINEQKLQNTIDQDIKDPSRLDQFRLAGKGQYNCKDWAQDRLNHATDTRFCCPKKKKPPTCK